MSYLIAGCHRHILAIIVASKIARFLRNPGAIHELIGDSLHHSHGDIKMFTDTEVGLALRYNTEVDQVTRQAQAMVDSKNGEIARLRRALSAALADNEDLRREKGRRAIAELYAFRAARRSANAH